MSTPYNTLSDLQDAIYDLLDPLFSGQIIWARQKAPQLTTPYFMLNLTTKAIELGAGYEQVRSGSSRTINQHLQCVLNIQAFGQGGVDELFQLPLKLYTEDFQANLLAANLAIVEVNDTLDLSELLDTEFQERASLDLSLSYTKDQSDGTDIIEIVQGTDPLGEDYEINGS